MLEKFLFKLSKIGSVKMPSTQKQYRIKRIKTLQEIILLASTMLTYTGFQLERVKFSDFEKIRNDLETLNKVANMC